jgi:RimJ/RimL family protein N-acetyltransferase
VERLTTADLVIRRPLPEDAPQAFILMNDPDVRRWSDGSHATWHAELLDTGQMVGNVSLFAIDTDDLVAKIGYRVLPAARGRGVARQMVDAVTRWAFAERGLMRVQLEHAVANPASCRVALAAGFALEGTARSAYAVPGGRREDCHIHGRLPTD